MASTSSAEPRTVRVDPERLQGWLTRFAERHGPVTPTPQPDRLRCTAPDGAVAEILLRWGPLPEAGDPLAVVVEQVCRERTVGALLVRRKAHGVGVFLGSRLLDGHHHSHYVQGRTKAGGWSQQRYARRRSNQADRAFAAAAEDAARILLPRLASLEAVVLGGERAATQSVLATPGLERLAELAGASHHPVYPVVDPNRTVLEAFPGYFRSVHIELNDLA